MKYVVSRTSIWGIDPNRPPCPNAKIETLLVADIRQFSSPDELPSKTVWYGGGQNHRVVEGCIVRDIPTNVWTVEIPDLHEFAREHGSIILESYANIATIDGKSIKLFKVEIYDDYRE